MLNYIINNILFAINGTDFINNPWNITFSTYTNLMGTSAYLVPVTFLSLALYMKTRSPLNVSMFILATSSLASGGAMFANYPELATIFGVFAAFGIVGIVLSLFFGGR